MYTCECGRTVAGARAYLLEGGGPRYAAYTERAYNVGCCRVGTIGTLAHAREQAVEWELRHTVGTDAPMFSPGRDNRELELELEL